MAFSRTAALSLAALGAGFTLSAAFGFGADGAASSF
jgi:hypothetical protein